MLTVTNAMCLPFSTMPCHGNVSFSNKYNLIRFFAPLFDKYNNFECGKYVFNHKEIKLFSLYDPRSLTPPSPPSLSIRPAHECNRTNYIHRYALVHFDWKAVFMPPLNSGHLFFFHFYYYRERNY